MIPTEPLTPLQESAARTGRRYFRATEVVYVALCAEVDARRGFPAGVGTRAVTSRSFPEPEHVARDENGDVLVSVETWRFDEDDIVMIDGAISAELVTELTDEEFAEARIDPSPPIEPQA